jgi:hypothetical protein
MIWTMINLVIQTLTGVLGARFAATDRKRAGLEAIEIACA